MTTRRPHATPQVRPALLHVHAAATASPFKHLSLFLANRMSKADVRDKAVSKERVDTVACAIHKLIGNDKVERPMFFFQRADGRQRNDPRDPKLLQPVNVGTVIQLRRHEAMSPPMTGQKSDASTSQRTQNVGIGGRAKWGLQRHLAHVGQPRHRVEAAPADNANFRLRQQNLLKDDVQTIDYTKRI